MKNAECNKHIFNILMEYLMDRFKFVPGHKTFAKSLGNDPARSIEIAKLLQKVVPTFLSTPKSSEGLINALNTINNGLEGGLTEGELVQVTFKLGELPSFALHTVCEMIDRTV